MLNTKHSFYLLLIAFLGSFSIKAQDSISLFKKINNQYSAERNFKNNFYYNPASMSDYSSSSFSEFNIGYHDDNQKIYREQLGAGSKGLSIEAKSFQKLKPNQFIWGSASYQNFKNRASKWNENLDFDRVAPYAAADSVGGELKLERYQFAGGYLQKINRWTLAGEVSYLAQLGYRSRDPRLKSTTSDLYVNAGVNYRVYRQYEIGIFGEFNKYTQNSSLAFANLLGRPYVYQMVGFGYSNYFFNGGTDPSETFEEFGYRGGLQITNKQGKDFYLRATAGRSNNIKSHSDAGTSTPFDISDLENKNFEFEGAKFFTIHENHRIGILANYSASIKTGSEYAYSVNTQFTEMLFKRKAYRKEDYNTSIKGFYQYSQDHFTISVSPFFGYQEIKERRLYPVTGQKFKYSYFGMNADYKQQIKENQILTFQPYFSKRAVNKSINALDINGTPGIAEWIMQDYLFQSSDITTFGVSLRYNIKLEKLPAFFISGQYQSQKIQEKNNNFTGVSLGITF
ncbi:hypothetical protein M2347_000572 [Chryseobacterium sp. H1D6B]|uniref:DUF6850 family outer membrane beta-barrel protein n=1 Tax=Chryseobacterium sp. H1D6B TaxID=2940588 RepID=UPI0015C97BB1|nr:DUF6850 family outer membrane beta-barrel protein [Chryseobacterium sp. H1D6B]MDH6250845.1 hypothetical protein [Chryseobacterium sp. H1D6B]